MINEPKKSSTFQAWAFEHISSPEGWSPERIAMYEKLMYDAFQALLPNKIITFVNNSSFYIDGDTGLVVPHDWKDPSKRFLTTSRRRIKCINDFCDADFKAKFVYIYKIEPVFGGPGEASCVYITMAEYNHTDKQADPVINADLLEKAAKSGILPRYKEQVFVDTETGAININGTAKDCYVKIKTEKCWGSPREEAFSWINSGLGFDPEHIELNKSTLEKYLKILLPNKVIHFIKEPGLDKVHEFWNAPYVTIDTETGTILDDDSDLTTKKVIKTKTFTMPGMDYFNDEWFTCKYLYIYKIIKHGTGVEIVAAEYDREKKKTVSFTVDSSVYEKFCRLSDTMAINKSRFVENKIKEFVEKNS